MRILPLLQMTAVLVNSLTTASWETETQNHGESNSQVSEPQRLGKRAMCVFDAAKWGTLLGSSTSTQASNLRSSSPDSQSLWAFHQVKGICQLFFTAVPLVFFSPFKRTTAETNYQLSNNDYVLRTSTLSQCILSGP